MKRKPEAEATPPPRKLHPGTSLIPTYRCPTCRDSGSHLVRTIAPDSIEADLAGRAYHFETCPVCKGTSNAEEAP